MDFTTVLLIVAYALLAYVIAVRFLPVKGLENLNAEQFRKRAGKKSGVLLVDVREPHEYKAGHIPSAVNIPLSQLKQRMKEFSPKNEVLLYCWSGMRSRQAGRILRKHGYTRLAHLQGGLARWKGALKQK